jgi:outer membrane protein OmpA-like peptidoglycan-associated protein
LSTRAIEREIAKQRAYKARAYLIAQGYAPNHIQITVVPIGEHVADNATKKGRAKNRRVEIEVMQHNPASIWPQWYG